MYSNKLENIYKVKLVLTCVYLVNVFFVFSHMCVAMVIDMRPLLAANQELEIYFKYKNPSKKSERERENKRSFKKEDFFCSLFFIGMNTSIFTDDEIQEQLRNLGFTNIPRDKFEMFKKGKNKKNG